MDITETYFWTIIGIVFTIIITIIAAVISIFTVRQTEQKLKYIKKELTGRIHSLEPIATPTVTDFMDGYSNLQDKINSDTFELALKFRDEHKYDDAIEKLRSLLKGNLTIEQYIAILSFIGNTQYLQGDYFSAKKSQRESLDIALMIQNKVAISDASGNLGILCNLTGEPEKALEYYNQSLE